jgi:site-specific recombinase XerD
MLTWGRGSRKLSVMGEPLATTRPVEAWLESLASPNTRAAYRNDFAVFMAWCQARRVNPLQATAADAEQFRSDLVAAGAPEGTARRRASAVHSFLRPRQGAEDRGGPAMGHGSSSTVLLDQDDRARLLGVLPEQSANAQVLIGLLLLDGLKLNEILDLDVPDISGAPPRLDVSVTRDATEELFTLHPTTSSYLHDHLAGRSLGPLLRGRGSEEGRLSRFGADYLVKRAGRDAGLRAPLTVNVLRRAYVSHAHDAGDHVEDIRHRVGHHDVRSTRRLLPPAGGQVGSVPSPPRNTLTDRR